MSTSPELPLAGLLTSPTRFLFFTGKGGVGKTSMACATAVALADRGRRVLLVSTDPASNLDEVLGVTLSTVPTAVPGAPGLSAFNIDPAAAAHAYREKLVGPFRGKLPEALVRSMEEQLSGACTMEIAAFDEVSRLLGDPQSTAGYDHVLFDTAPTGHTLRLLSLPGAWSGFIDANPAGASCLGPLSGLEAQRAVYAQAVASLIDPARTTLVLVSRAQRAALAEARRTSHELSLLGVSHQRLILNGLFHADGNDPTALALERRERDALAGAAAFLEPLVPGRVPLRSTNLVGLAALRALTAAPSEFSSSPGEAAVTALPECGTLSDLVTDLARQGHGVVMTLGKGGVGKTTIAAAIATELAKRGFKVRLTTTDPAAHVAAAIGDGTGVAVDRIDPHEETRRYAESVLGSTGTQLDANGRALLEEDLRSPCTEEIAVFRAFARTVAQGRDEFVILDTAPTGHTLLLLDATESYHREIAKKASDLPAEVRELLPRLRDPDFTKMVVVTLPEPTPVHEAALLQTDLRRAGIEPFAWVINQSLAGCGTQDPLLRQRAAGETRFIREVAEGLARRTIRVPWVLQDPVGAGGLAQLFAHAAVTAPA
jgi:arsenite-transporting ATPase